MVQSYILEIPDISYLLKWENVLEWQVYGPDQSGNYEKINWRVESSSNKVMLKSNTNLEKTQKNAEIDFSTNRIIIHKGNMNDSEFTKFLQFLLEKAILSTSESEMNFIICAKKSQEKVFGIRG